MVRNGHWERGITTKINKPKLTIAACIYIFTAFILWWRVDILIEE
jgi:hypothetical protein